MAGVSQPSPLFAARQRAQALAQSGDVPGARLTLEHAVELGRSKLGEDDPDVLATLHQLARLHQRSDDPMAARRVLEEAYAAGQWRLGDSDPLMLEISFDLGVVAEELGNRHEARKAFGRVAGPGAAILGASHWAVERARAYLGDEAPAEGALTIKDPLPYAGIAPALTGPTVVQPVVRVPPVSSLSSAGPVPVLAEQSPYRKRGIAIYAAIAASLAAVIAVVALVFGLANRGGDGPDKNVPNLSGKPPGDVALVDQGTTITVTWADPAGGGTTFVVWMAHPGEALKNVVHVPPGTTSYQMVGLSSKLDYCFVVSAVYASDKFGNSTPSCTHRSATK
jgi:hypothetical protein